MRLHPALVFAALTIMLRAAPAHAQHSGHQHPAPADTAAAGAAHHDHAHMDHGAAGHGMTGFYGPYPMSREASGTAWQPDRSPHEGLHVMSGGWMIMLHGFANVIYDWQGGGRGDEKVVGTNMAMAMGTRPLGPGTAGFRVMLSAEPATTGVEGYPLLLQTGETADGHDHLIDRQHPHDLFMELAGTYSVADATRSAFVYFGLPGEPAIGPPAFMHRFSGIEIPESPIGHHWLDSTHITFGVATFGLVTQGLKLEGSLFTGREPDQDRWNIEEPKFDSYSFRASWNPSPRVSTQASYGHIVSPEQLEPEVDVDRTTVSIMFDSSREGRPWQTMAAWGRNVEHPGRTLDAYLLESTMSFGGANTVMGRVERVEKTGLFQHHDPRAEEAYVVGKLGLGYVRDLVGREHWTLGVGGYGDVSFVPQSLEGEYDKNPPAAMVFARIKLR